MAIPFSCFFAVVIYISMTCYHPAPRQLIASKRIIAALSFISQDVNWAPYQSSNGFSISADGGVFESSNWLSAGLIYVGSRTYLAT